MQDQPPFCSYVTTADLSHPAADSAYENIADEVPTYGPMSPHPLDLSHTVWVHTWSSVHCLQDAEFLLEKLLKVINNWENLYGNSKLSDMEIKEEISQLISQIN